MKQSEIVGIIEKRFEKIDAAFDNVRMHLNEDDIRLFRVKVKKLEACLHLIDPAKDHPHPIKLPQKIARTYRLSGAIRTLQVQQNQVQKTLKGKQILPPETYLKLISDQLLQHISVFNKHIKGTKPFKKEEEKLLALLPKHLSQETVQQFIQSNADRFEKLFTPVFLPDKSFHEARKLLKTLLYTSPYLQMDISTIFPYPLLSTYEDIDALTIVLGGFHDLETAINCLHKECQKIEIDENEKSVLRNIENLWVKEREAFRKKIYDEIEKITASGRPAETLVKWPVM
jgi:CHAD domain-containing protein